MSWEASRWTAKTPSELYHTLGPHGVDELIRHGLASVWRFLPEEGRTFDLARETARNMFDRHIRIWRRIKKPTPQEFFTDLGAHEADGYFRKAMVTAWMMMPRTGGRAVNDCLRIVTSIFLRNLDGWEQDNATFTAGAGGGKRAARRTKGKRPMDNKPNPQADKEARIAKARPNVAPKVAPKARGAARAKDSEVAPLRAEMKRRAAKAGAGKSKVATQ